MRVIQAREGLPNFVFLRCSAATRQPLFHYYFQPSSPSLLTICGCAMHSLVQLPPSTFLPAPAMRELLRGSPPPAAPPLPPALLGLCLPPAEPLCCPQ